ncbi:MAG: hypothetical protein JOZ49_02780, partial [Mycolicibacterium sp.]|nr:hypothetical protein [Mycolicibacterium sp.]
AGAGRGFWTEFSAALGFVGLSLLGVEFALVARVRSVAAPFGTDALVQFHRQIGRVGFALVRIVKPIVALRRPWAVRGIRAERGDTTTLTFRPKGHTGLRFAPGHYAWITVGKSPFSITSHPFSFSSSGENAGQVDVSIKSLGDFTGTIADIEVGTTAYLDGPHGVFTPDQYEGPGFCFIAGGVGITPVVSILRTFADRADMRPVVAIVGNRDWDGATFREVLDELAARLNLTVVHVLTDPPAGWHGETGHIDEALLRRHLGRGGRRWQYFVCGPPAMMDAVSAALLATGIPGSQIHSERFNWI